MSYPVNVVPRKLRVGVGGAVALAEVLGDDGVLVVVDVGPPAGLHALQRAVEVGLAAKMYLSGVALLLPESTASSALEASLAIASVSGTLSNTFGNEGNP